MDDKQIKSAIIIQRRFRKYLAKKGEGNKVSNFYFEGKKPNISHSKTNDWVEETQKQINEIYESLATFYKSLPGSFDRAKHLNNMLAGIDETIRNFQNVSFIQDSQKLLRSDVSEDARRKHDEALKKVNAKWWENL